METSKQLVGRLKLPLMGGSHKKQIKNNTCKLSVATCFFLIILIVSLILMVAYYLHGVNNMQSNLRSVPSVDLQKIIFQPTNVPIVVPTLKNDNTNDIVRVVNTIIPTRAPTTPNIPSNNAKKMQTLKLKPTNKKQKTRKPKDPFDFVVNIDSDWGFHGEYKYIKVMPTLKMDIKKDRRVIFPNLTITLPVRSNEPSTNVLGEPRELLKANEILKRHPLHQIQHSNKELDDVMFYIKNTEFCTRQPVFLSMATVHDDLYWQLIENFVYTMVKFKLSECSLVICVSDPKCMSLCEQAHFPCYNYVEHQLPLPSVMEQIAAVKLLHVPKALTRGVDVFMLDLDVGFLEDPKYMVQAFEETPIVDIMVQEDYIFIMNRSTVGWKSWFTEPLPNIGLFLCRGNNKTAQVFRHAWGKYLKMDDDYEKSKPGIDQNHVLDAMRIGRGNYGLKYAYYSNATAPLLDKLVMNHGNVMELGGELMANYLHSQKSVAMHTTCYEKSTKVMGLKATNSFWNPRYYDPLRPTITKQILFLDESQLLDEVRSLVWLAISTGRSLIITNILGNEHMNTIAPYKKQVMWPGFRVTFLKRDKGKSQLKVTILEPSYYWRVERDYDPVPDPHVVFFDPAKESLMDIKTKLSSVSHPRVVLHALKTSLQQETSSQTADLTVDSPASIIQREIEIWSNDSVGLFSRPWTTMVKTYVRIPSVKTARNDILANEVLQGMRNCAHIFGPSLGNRTCFQICD